MNINEFDANAVIQATTIVRLMSKKDNGKALNEYLKEQEIKIDGVWNKPSLKAIKVAEEKFTRFMKENNLMVNSPQPKYYSLPPKK